MLPPEPLPWLAKGRTAQLAAWSLPMSKHLLPLIVGLVAGLPLGAAQAAQHPPAKSPPPAAAKPEENWVQSVEARKKAAARLAASSKWNPALQEVATAKRIVLKA